MLMLILFLEAYLLIVVVGSVWLIRRLARPRRATLGVVLARRLPTDPGHVGLTGDEVTLSLNDGGTTPAWRLEGRKPDGPIIVMTHGYADCRHGMLPLARHFAEHASRLVLYDLRAHGESTSDDCSCGTAEADDVLVILNQIGSWGDDWRGPVVLFGQSMGAGVVLAAASAKPAGSRIAMVIVEGVYRTRTGPVARMLWRRGWPPYPFVWIAEAWFAHWYQSTEKYDRLAHAQSLEVPLLALHGAEDHWCPIADAEAIADQSPYGELVRFEQGGHFDLVDSDKARYLDALSRAFERTSGGASDDR